MTGGLPSHDSAPERWRPVRVILPLAAEAFCCSWRHRSLDTLWTAVMTMHCRVIHHMCTLRDNVLPNPS